MRQFKSYPKYKDSEVEWLGEIPEEWSTIRIKYIFKEINVRSTDGEEDLLSVSQYTGVTKKSDKIDDGDLLTTATTLEGYKRVFKGDLVSNIMLAWNGSLGFSPFDGITSPAYSTYRLFNANDKGFFHYLLRSEIYKAEFKRNSSGVIESRLRLYTDDFFRIWAIHPPLAEQTAIASFLDDKTAKIDKAIAQKEKMIALLKERKQILIQNTVTKGLDPTAKMKDSGVEWIGEIPEGWEMARLKHVYSNTFSGGTPSTDKENFWNGGIPWISSADVKSAVITNTLRNISAEGLARSSAKIAPSGSVIIVTRSGILQHTLPVAMVPMDMAINQDIKCFILKKKIAVEYLLSFVKGKNKEILIETRQQGATVESINLEQFANLQIAIPPLPEQNAIAEFISLQSAKIDTSIALQEKQIAKLKEYKTTLIDSAVTGKIKVC